MTLERCAPNVRAHSDWASRFASSSRSTAVLLVGVDVKRCASHVFAAGVAGITGAGAAAGVPRAAGSVPPVASGVAGVTGVVPPRGAVASHAGVMGVAPTRGDVAGCAGAELAGSIAWSAGFCESSSSFSLSSESFASGL